MKATYKLGPVGKTCKVDIIRERINANGSVDLEAVQTIANGLPLRAAKKIADAALGATEYETDGFKVVRAQVTPVPGHRAVYETHPNA